MRNRIVAAGRRSLDRLSRTLGVPAATNRVFEQQIADIRRHTPLRQGLTVQQHPRRNGWSRLDVVFVTAILCLLGLLLAPTLVRLRERSRQQTCQQRLHILMHALQQYEDVQGTLPPAAIWDADVTESLALQRSRRIELVTRENWALLLLPHVNPELTALSSPQPVAIGAAAQAAVRSRRVATWICPSDDLNRSGNPYRLASSPRQPPLEFARGNYALNGGTHHFETEPPTTAAPCGDFLHLETSTQPRRFAMWGNGIAGINTCWNSSKFSNGRSTLIALEEVRAGVNANDPRGVWALGQIGGSITWGHGANGDDAGPNNNWTRADDILGCPQLHQNPGPQALQELGMPCVDYVDANQQATARSQHPGGVFVSFLDGSVRMISNGIDSGLWHVLHSRETPREWLAHNLDDQLLSPPQASAAISPATAIVASKNIEPPANSRFDGSLLRNSLGLTFVSIPAGTFLMGLPDRGNQTAIPPECRAHEVELTHPYWLGTHEVTQQQFLQVMRSKTVSDFPTDLERSPTLPATGVTWFQAINFCRQLSELPQERAAGRTYRIPSEAEWEFAARAGARTPYAWHLEREAGDLSGEAAGILPPLPLQPTGSFPPNRWGLYDMRGNAWEWTNDWYARDAYQHSPRRNPLGPASGHLKVVRGSDWRFVGEPCHIDGAVLPPWKANPVVGFRIVCEPQGPNTGQR